MIPGVDSTVTQCSASDVVTGDAALTSRADGRRLWSAVRFIWALRLVVLFGLLLWVLYAFPEYRVIHYVVLILLLFLP